MYIIFNLVQVHSHCILYSGTSVTLIVFHSMMSLSCYLLAKTSYLMYLRKTWHLPSTHRKPPAWVPLLLSLVISIKTYSTTILCHRKNYSLCLITVHIYYIRLYDIVFVIVMHYIILYYSYLYFIYTVYTCTYICIVISKLIA